MLGLQDEHAKMQARRAHSLRVIGLMHTRLLAVGLQALLLELRQALRGTRSARRSVSE